MAHVLTWKVLNQEQAKRCSIACDINDVRAILQAISKENASLARGHDGDREASFRSFPYSDADHNSGQARILIDYYAHAVLFACSLGMSVAKLSSFIGILYELHETSMSRRLSRPASYDVLRALIVRHSVARPPYSAAVFNLDDVREIDEYLMSTYYRHYKMYYFAFVPKQVASIRVVPLGAVTEVPPSLPPLVAATPEDEWKQKVEAHEQLVEAARMEEMLRESEALEEQRLRQTDLNDPHYSDGIREQLEMIRNAVLQQSTDRLDVLEEKLASIEAKVDETFSKSRPASKSTTRKK